MKNYKVKDLMVSLSEYATVSEDATLFEVVLALEKAQEAFEKNRYTHGRFWTEERAETSSARSVSWMS